MCSTCDHPCLGHSRCHWISDAFVDTPSPGEHSMARRARSAKNSFQYTPRARRMLRSPRGRPPPSCFRLPPPQLPRMIPLLEPALDRVHLSGHLQQAAYGRRRITMRDRCRPRLISKAGQLKRKPRAPPCGQGVGSRLWMGRKASRALCLRPRRPRRRPTVSRTSFCVHE